MNELEKLNFIKSVVVDLAGERINMIKTECDVHLYSLTNPLLRGFSFTYEEDGISVVGIDVQYDFLREKVKVHYLNDLVAEEETEDPRVFVYTVLKAVRKIKEKEGDGNV